MDDDEAMIAMVDSNFQREKVLPSEWGEALKMKVQALKRKAGRPQKNSLQNATNFQEEEEQKNSLQNATNFDTAGEVGGKLGMTRDKVYRYIRITELSDFLRDLIDENRISMGVAVNLSYLSLQEQQFIQDYFEGENVIITAEQSQKLKAESKELKKSKDKKRWSNLSEKQVWDILSKNEKPKPFTFSFSQDVYSKYFKGDESKSEVQQIICEALDDWLAKKGRKVD